MSLLLDALKRAEQEKLARQGGPGSVESAPPPPPTTSRGTAFELEALDSGRPAPPPPGTLPPPKPSAGDRANAQAVFAAKTPRPLPGAPTKAPIFVGAFVVVLLVAAGAAYVWIQINAINAPQVAARPVSSSAASAIRPVLPGAPMQVPVIEPPTPLMPPAAPVPPPASGYAPGTSAAPPVARVRPENLSPGTKGPAPPREAENAVIGLLQENAQRGTAAPPPLKLARSIEPSRIAPEVFAGYDALVRGDLGTARRNYLAALAAEPNSIDALLGLGTVDARSGDRAGATRAYRRVLAADPRNAAALAGLAAVADYSRPEALESSLLADIKRYPDSAALQMTLGNLYASQSRWTDAQTAFFEAHRLEPDNADVLYNLAVALDNVNQPRLAGDFYRKALAQARGRTVQFDARVAERRAADLRR